MEEKRAPGILLAGTMFLLDKDNMRLFEKENPQNVIPLDKMNETTNGYVIELDTYLKKMASDQSDPNNVQLLFVPTKMMMESKGIPIGKTSEYGDISILSGNGVNIDSDLIKWRLDNHLPRIKFIDEMLEIDLAAQILRAEGSAPRTIQLKELSIVGFPENQYAGFYDLQKGQVVEIDATTIKKLPENVVFIEVPPIETLDPIGLARLQGLDDLYHVRQFGISKDLSITVTPLEGSLLELYVEENVRAEKEAQKQDPAKPAQKNTRSWRARRKGI